jgi:hypothetical protein
VNGDVKRKEGVEAFAGQSASDVLFVLVAGIYRVPACVYLTCRIGSFEVRHSFPPADVRSKPLEVRRAFSAAMFCSSV